MNELNHVAIIMDGNSRWGRSRGVSNRKAYNSGVEAAKKIVTHAKKCGIKYLTLFAFSTENWRRDQSVTALLMEIFSSYFEDYLINIQNDINKGGDIKISFIGERSIFCSKIQEQMKKIESLQIDNPKINLRIAMNYGGKEDIEKASQDLVLYYLEKFCPKKITQLQDDQEKFAQKIAKIDLEYEIDDQFKGNNCGHQINNHENRICNKGDLFLHHNDQNHKTKQTIKSNFPESPFLFDKKIGDIINPDGWPDPELLIRTGGDRRLSNFILWYLSYTELYFVEDFWPDFDESAFDKAIENYKKRERRFGG